MLCSGILIALFGVRRRVPTVSRKVAVDGRDGHRDRFGHVLRSIADSEQLDRHVPLTGVRTDLRPPPPPVLRPVANPAIVRSFAGTPDRLLNRVGRIELAMGLQIVEQDADSSRPLISALTAAVYPPEVLAVMPWRDVQSARSQRRIMVLDEDNSIVATAGLLVRDAMLNEAPVRIGGVGGVMTDPARQNSGLGRMAMDAVADLMVRWGGIGFGVLFCEAKNIGFYSKLGWGVFHGVVRITQDRGDVIYDIMTTMVRPVSASAPRSGSLDLRGRPW